MPTPGLSADFQIGALAQACLDLLQHLASRLHCFAGLHSPRSSAVTNRYQGQSPHGQGVQQILDFLIPLQEQSFVPH